ncbi:S ribonuclease [Pyrus ussuriensis x Pyrus communis]|uniref:S ribonuclease n=1 Tax=Pyrus ussuriensis x Pyrus communis TaxID=2448454 RepID=A0A5N5GC13_9ROSA|nr:S ribonuclease [Pyrus ussuriensis x Pyrus communis]
MVQLGIVWYADGTGRNGIGRDGTGQDETERNGAGAKMPSDGNKEEEEGDGEGVRWNKNSPKTRPMEQLVPPVLGAPNVGRNALSHSVPSRPTYQTVP